jgi:thiamine biosynthesis lipoprotein
MCQTSVAESTDFGMNTEIIYKVFGENAQEALNFGKGELARLENRLSRFISGSEISRINESAGIRPVKISNEAYEVLSNAIRFSEISEGLFDITIGSLVDLWDYKHAFKTPEEARIQQVLPLVNYCDLVLDPRERTAKLRKPGQAIDLGGIGKGFASDRFIERLKEFGSTSAFTNIGGNVSTLGNKPDGSPWCVGIRHPRQDGCLLGAVGGNRQGGGYLRRL